MSRTSGKKRVVLLQFCCRTAEDGQATPPIVKVFHGVFNEDKSIIWHGSIYNR